MGVNRLSRLIMPASMAALLLAGGCSGRPDGVLSDREMESLLADMMLAEAYDRSGEARDLPDSVRRTIGGRVLARHGVDHESLDSTYSWYARNLDDYYKLYANVGKRLENQRRKIAGTSQMDEQPLNDIWALPGHIWFSPLADSEALVFQIPGDAVEKGERLQFKMSLSAGGEAEVMFGIEYADGTSVVAQRSVGADRKLDQTLVSDTALDARRIFGVVRVPRRARPMWADSIILLKLPFDSVAYGNAWGQRRYSGPRPKPKPADTSADSISQR